MRLVQSDDESGARVNEAFWDHFRVHDSTEKGLLNVFLKRSEELGLHFLDCRGQLYDNELA